jgi:cell wall assembly regulator SMI1
MNEIWDKIKQNPFLIQSDVLNTLTLGAKIDQIESLKQVIGTQWNELFESLEVVNGQDPSNPPLFQRFSLFSADEIAANYALMNDEVVPDLLDSGIDLEEGESEGPVKPQIWNKSWIPLAGDGGNFICLDGDPDEGGDIGQVFIWWRDGSANQWVAPSYQVWLEQLKNKF